MFVDFNNLDDRTELTGDVCIVGAGAAGITIALEFVGSNYTVVLLEGGGLDVETDSQDLYASEVIGLPHGGIHSGRAKIFGGTTTLWAGQALRFDANEFRQRSWIPYSGWPISREELDPYYERAERVMGLGNRLSYEELCALCNVKAPTFEPTKLSIECSQWSPSPNFGMRYRGELSEAHNISVVLHANATSILTNETATRVQEVEFKSLIGKRGSVTARFYVLCSGAIETARLLLVSNGVDPRGVGNKYDLVGRYFQDHLHIRCGELRPANRQRLQDLFESFFTEGQKYAPKIALARQFQTERRLLSAHGEVIFDAIPDSSLVALKELYRVARRRRTSDANEIRGWLWTAFAEPGEPIRLAYRLYAKQRIGVPRRGPVYLGAQCETVPNPDSRITLSDSRDALQIPRVRLDWRVGELERHTLAQLVRLIAAELQRLQLGCFDIRQIDALDDEHAWLKMVCDSFHHAGTTRMHDSPRFGVVNRNCQVHDVSNLYIGSCSVFPTSARSNPTLTALALCVRIADQFKQVLRGA